jgi:hypothetical protein
VTLRVTVRTLAHRTAPVPEGIRRFVAQPSTRPGVRAIRQVGGIPSATTRPSMFEELRTYFLDNRAEVRALGFFHALSSLALPAECPSCLRSP